MMTAALFVAIGALAVWAWHQIGDLSTRDAARAEALREIGERLADVERRVDDDRRAADQRHRLTSERVARALATAQVADTAITAMEAAMRSKRPKKRGAK